ncbi:MAG: hypothetical protein WDM70_09105 [Nitrosomonadales bacterium]
MRLQKLARNADAYTATHSCAGKDRWCVDRSMFPCPVFWWAKNLSQLRLTTANKGSPSNYLEGMNLSAFATPVAATNGFIGVSVFNATNPSADVLKCLS